MQKVQEGPLALVQSFLSTVLLSIAIGAFLVGLRHMLHLARRLAHDAGLMALSAGLLLVLHLLSRDLFGLDPWYGLGFELAKHGLELLVVAMILVAF